MARKRIQNEVPRRKWGANRPYEIKIKRPDGTFYVKHRVAYRVEVLEGDNWLEKRRYADSLESAEEALRLAAKRQAENKREVDAYWAAKRGDTALPSQGDQEIATPVLPQAPRNATLTKIAEEMLGVSRRWRGGKLTQLSHTYLRRIHRYIRLLEASGLSSRAARALQSAEVQA